MTATTALENLISTYASSATRFGGTDVDLNTRMLSFITDHAPQLLERVKRLEDALKFYTRFVEIDDGLGTQLYEAAIEDRGKIARAAIDAGGGG